MRILMLSISHRTASVELREKLAFSGERLDAAVDALRRLYPQSEAVLLSTCNRTELYIARPEHESPKLEQLDEFLAGFCMVPLTEVTAAAVHREQDQAVAHLFRVATGLDSMVLGEPQILGQVKRAYEHGMARQAVGSVLHRVFQQAITIAKLARSKTGIDEGRVSVGSVAVDFASQIFDHFNDKIMVAIGAGEMAKLTLQHLKALKPARLWLTNRTQARAAALAEQLGLIGAGGTGGAGGAGGADAVNAGIRPFEELDELLVEADVVVTSTGATQPIITANRMRPLVKRRRSRPLIIIDIAVPRDVEAGVGSLSNVYLYNIDDLQRVVMKTHEDRSALVEQCETMVFDAVRACLASIQHRDVGHLIKALREKFHGLAAAERERTLKKLAATPMDDLAPAVKEALEEHDHRLLNKILHMPLSQLNQKDPNAPMAFFAAALRQLFNLQDESAGVNPAAPTEPGEVKPTEIAKPIIPASQPSRVGPG